jgi:hypothetical protein
MAAERQPSFKVDVPNADADRVRLNRVGVIALAGFVIGILWPWLAGVKLVPSAPSEDQAPAAEGVPPEGSGEPAASAELPAVPPPPAAKLEKGAAEPSDRVKIGEPQITSCRDDKGAKRSECGALEFDALARPRIQALGGCEPARAASGMLSLGFELDFAEKRVKEVLRGKSTTLSEEHSKALVECAKKEFANATLSDIKNQHAAYTVFYRVELLPPGSSAAPAEASGDAGAEVTAASGRATVSWEVAILRSLPREGDVVARILRGTRVVVTGRQGDWYKVRYDAKGNEGWVYRTAIGL